MVRRRQLIYKCGGALPFPPPGKCPHCDAKVVGIRPHAWPRPTAILAAPGMFIALALYLFWLLQGL
jgi:hypothetical protein